MEVGTTKAEAKDGLRSYYKAKIEEFEIAVRDKTQNLRRLEAQRNELNTKGEFFFSPILGSPPFPFPIQTTCALTARKERDGRLTRAAYRREHRSYAMGFARATCPALPPVPHAPTHTHTPRTQTTLGI